MISDIFVENISNRKIQGFPDTLRKFKNIHKDENCIIMGSGPSLNTIPYSFLNKYKVFSVNSSYLYFPPDYMATLDVTFSKFEIARYYANRNKIPFFISWKWLLYRQEELANINFGNEIGIPYKNYEVCFSDRNVPLWDHILNLYNSPEYLENSGAPCISNSVSELAIPLAAYMGFQKIFLAGVDFTENVNEQNHHFNLDPADYVFQDHDRWKQLEGNKYGSGGIWKIKRYSMELIKESALKDRVFNLSLESSIKGIKKIPYQFVELGQEEDHAYYDI